jgi:hypothetical protein
MRAAAAGLMLVLGGLVLMSCAGSQVATSPSPVDL